MKIYKSLEAYKKLDYPVVTIGTFDGVHLGHQQIIKRQKEVAEKQSGESVLLTFWPHPRMVLQPDFTGLRLLNTLDEKIERLEKYGLDHLLIIAFDKKFARLNSIEFIRDILVNAINTKYLIVGYDHHFGRNREGTFEELKECAPLYGFEIEQIQPYFIDNVTVSSTKIRNALLDGNVKLAAHFLAQPYALNGTVTEGRKYGRTIGFPTANLHIPETFKLIPKDGVYITLSKINGRLYPSMTNIGERPTVKGKNKTIETHIFDFNENLYNKNIKIYFLERLRDEINFSDTTKLQQQLETDKVKAEYYFEKNNIPKGI